jgi:hypothetical protein
MFSDESSPTSRAHSRWAAEPSSGGQSGMTGFGRGSYLLSGRFPGLPVYGIFSAGNWRRLAWRARPAMGAARHRLGCDKDPVRWNAQGLPVNFASFPASPLYSRLS